MTDRKDTQKEVTRLRRSVKRRRLYAQDLKRSASDIETTAPTDEERAFAVRLRDLADSELGAARMEETAATEMDQRITTAYASSHSMYTSEESKARHEAAMKALEGRLSSDRARHLLIHVGAEDLGLYVGEAMTKVEELMGIDYGDARPQVGKRIENAEIKAFGAVRF